MESNQLVSVVIPCYNQGSFLRQSIESVLSQRYQNIELIVVDDGSTDNSRAVATGYSAIRYIHQSNQGPGAARNAGLRESKGDYLVFVDADDRILPSALEVGVSTMEAHPECAFVSGHVRLIAKDGSHVRTPEESCIQKDHYITLLRYNYIWTPAAVMFRRSAVESVDGYSCTLFGTEDWDIYLRIARNFPLYCHDQIIAEYRVHEHQITFDAAHMLKESLVCLRRQWVYIKGKKQFEEAYRKGIREAQNYFGEPLVHSIQANVKSSQWKQALLGTFVLLRYDPLRLVKHLVGAEPNSTVHG